MRLQQTVGNRATGKLIAGRDRQHSPAAVQRKADEESGTLFGALGDAWDKVTEAAESAFDWLSGGDQTQDNINQPAGAPKGKKKPAKIVPLVPPSGPVLVTDDQALIRREPPNLTSLGKDKLIPSGTWVRIEEAVQKGDKQYVRALPLHLESAPADIQNAPPEVGSAPPEIEEGPDQTAGWTAASNVEGLVMDPKGEGPAVEPEKPEKPETLEEELKRIDEMKITLERGENDQELIDQIIAENAVSEEERGKLDKLGKKEDPDTAPKVSDFETELKALTETQRKLAQTQSDGTLDEETKERKVAELEEKITGHMKTLNKMKKTLLGRLPSKNKRQEKTIAGMEGELKMQILFARHGLTPEQWFAGIHPNATFLGQPIQGQGGFKKLGLGGVHAELYDKLKRAEQILMDETGLDAEKTGKKLGVRYVGGLRAGNKRESVSLHKLGLAVDINAGSSNPWIKESSRDPILRATQLINADPFDLRMKSGPDRRKKRVKQAEEMFQKLTDVGTALEIYFKFRTDTKATLKDGRVLSLEKLASAYAAATGERLSVSEWQEQINTDYDTLKNGNYGSKRNPAKASGTMNLDKRLVMAMVKAGLTWGAFFHKDQGKDIMHFDWRGGTIIEKIRQKI